MAKDETYNRLIHTTRWLKLRRAILSRHPFCKRCEEEGRLRLATELHHIRPVEAAVDFLGKESLMFDPGNLRPLCHACHVKTHEEMGRSGKDARKQRAKEQLQDFKKKFLGENS